MYPNSALSAWQLAVIAVVAVSALACWLAAVYLAARDPSGHDRAAAGSTAGPAATGDTGAASDVGLGSGSRSPVAAGEREPQRPAA